ncbi:MAG: hypothetical protein AAGJ81_12690 [Verrucomicrobiota bacterium]
MKIAVESFDKLQAILDNDGSVNYDVVSETLYEPDDGKQYYDAVSVVLGITAYGMFRLIKHLISVYGTGLFIDATVTPPLITTLKGVKQGTTHIKTKDAKGNEVIKTYADKDISLEAIGSYFGQGG